MALIILFLAVIFCGIFTIINYTKLINFYFQSDSDSDEEQEALSTYLIKFETPMFFMLGFTHLLFVLTVPSVITFLHNYINKVVKI